MELADDIGILVDSHAPDAVSFQGPSRHSAGLSGNVVSQIHTRAYACAHNVIRTTLPRYSLSTTALGSTLTQTSVILAAAGALVRYRDRAHAQPRYVEHDNGWCGWRSDDGIRRRNEAGQRAGPGVRALENTPDY